MTSTILEVSSNCWKLHGCVWARMIKRTWTFSCLFFLIFFFNSSTIQSGWETPSQKGLHISHPGLIGTFVGWMEDSGLVSIQHFSLIGFIASVERWSKDELSSVTMPLARLLTFCLRAKSKNQTEFSLRWTLLGHNALGFCTAEPCNESQGWC